MPFGTAPYAIPAIMTLGCVIIFLAIWALVAWRKSSHDAAASFSSLLTGIAILVAGYWYLVERRGAPHADLAQTATVTASDAGFAIVETTLGIKNLGSTLLKIRSIDLRLQRMDSSGLDLKQVAEAGYDRWPERFADDRTPMFVGAELQWPTIKYFRRNVIYDIEPGETDSVVSTFLVPCMFNTVRVAAEVEKESAEHLSWKTRTILSTREACKGGRKTR